MIGLPVVVGIEEARRGDCEIDKHVVEANPVLRVVVLLVVEVHPEDVLSSGQKCLCGWPTCSWIDVSTGIGQWPHLDTLLKNYTIGEVRHRGDCERHLELA